ncbi:MAG TPA: GntG family PLP-dependent aldolase [Candidatus Kapabacteria bacterium]|nr:GntG family PLP-dependent aldolase [Candidatus Kapabacteria bacterium]
MIDLRSDTLTRPDEAMRQALANAEVGDDVYGEDPTANLLQERIADYFGKEAALFVPSGTMSNQLSLKVLTSPGDEIIADADAHIFYYETAAPSIVSNVQIRTIRSQFGFPDLNDIERSIRPDIYYFPRTSVICVENTHNRHGGTIAPIEYIQQLRDLANSYNIKLHLDGARIWNAIVETGIDGTSYAKYFDTISVCLSKGLGAPVGSLLISSAEYIEKARHWRKILGGGMRQVGILAAAGLYALDNNLPRLKADHENARLFASLLSEIEVIKVDMARIQTNIVRFELATSINPLDFIEKCKKNGLLLSHFDGQIIRAVFYLEITSEQARTASEIIKYVLQSP